MEARAVTAVPMEKVEMAATQVLRELAAEAVMEQVRQMEVMVEKEAVFRVMAVMVAMVA
jgi:hypothetical protein